ncbi:MAG: DNA-directed RNA polymerase subunit alpha [Candidatus Magasanikbacteria bacterium CG10_big_fil_rev_8_21_14_0_10_36_32]|uniref:DNA-directed RNA polymerase subunit alpha n=1 Tax=Candidatus Magasanikbacteria bacterium CG10_big_fil_rev_8_21_14_0_10_36_32 TaxID=1974646 RepID=A0A2M6W7G5_9BACT|nr:MAG: DNA-directed RNA polymerase subunit alpha [Candidatus Magasanikbacteria bacterium CG10_big_fil_rev_8_21_14_0_10_36_32]
MENLLLPSKVEFQQGEQANAGSIVIMPCYHGYGATLGNALRRVLLSSLPGAAVESFKIRGVQHEFTTVEGVKEDVVEVMLNLKQLIVKVYGDEPVVLSLSKKGPGVVTADDFEGNSNVEIFNKDLVIANLTNNKTFELEVTVGSGRGFKAAEEKDRQNFDLGTIMVDSIYTPVRDVGYHIEFARVGDITNYEKLTVNIETNGTITPSEAMRQATQILIDHFNIVLLASQEQSGKDGVSQTEVAEEDVVETETEPKTKKTKAVKAKKKTKK